jgi:pimeloyl-ACP methyl ester carboxylesterase
MISRRRFTQALAGTVVATSLAACSKQDSPAPVATADLRAGSGKNTTLGPIKQIDAGVLNIGYAEFGPATGQPVLLLHGWPYDAGSYIDVAPLLAAEGYRVIVPYLRGYGPTTFLSAQTMRNAQQSVVALDIIALMDALGIQKAVLGGFDWGARTVAIIAALWPERCKAIVSVSGYLITSLKANLQPLPPAAEYGWWYQYYFATERGAIGYRQNRRDFNELIWKIVSPQWNFDGATYGRTAVSFDNPDHVDIVIHNYRWRLSLAPGEPQYDVHEQKLATAPAISVPAITIGSDFDGAAADGMSYRDKFTGKYAHRVFAGIGHNVPQEAPEAFAQAIMDADHL